MDEISGDRIDATQPRATARPEDRQQVCETFDGADGVRRARWFAAAAVAQWGGAHDPDVLALVVTELVSNAVAHGGGSCELRIVPAPGFVRIEVVDQAPLAPVVRELDVAGEGGRGMLLVEALTSTWGCEASAAGKVVWATVPF